MTERFPQCDVARDAVVQASSRPWIANNYESSDEVPPHRVSQGVQS